MDVWGEALHCRYICFKTVFQSTSEHAIFIQKLKPPPAPTPNRHPCPLSKILNPFTADPTKALHFAIYWSNTPLLILDIRALRTEHQSARMSRIKNGGLDQYGAEPFEQQQFWTAGVEGVNISVDAEVSQVITSHKIMSHNNTDIRKRSVYSANQQCHRPNYSHSKH